MGANKNIIAITIRPSLGLEMEQWSAVYNTFCDTIGAELNDKNWQQTFGLYESKNNIPIGNLYDFVQIFDKLLKNGEKFIFKITVEYVVSFRRVFLSSCYNFYLQLLSLFCVFCVFFVVL